MLIPFIHCCSGSICQPREAAWAREKVQWFWKKKDDNEEIDGKGNRDAGGDSLPFPARLIRVARLPWSVSPQSPVTATLKTNPSMAAGIPLDERVTRGWGGNSTQPKRGKAISARPWALEAKPLLSPLALFLLGGVTVEGRGRNCTSDGAPGCCPGRFVWFCPPGPGSHP